MLFSSGDNGDFGAVTGIRQAGYPDSDPYVTGVGGTSTAIGPDGSMDWETGWGTYKYTLSPDGTSWQPIAPVPFLYGAGGGFSMLFQKPAYQNGVVNSTAPGRGTPDVALDADPTTGMLIGQTQTFPHTVAYGEFREGGTSLASPMMAGMVALAVQHAGGDLGFLNPAIYDQARTGAGTFDDVTSVHHGDGNVRPDFVNGINARNGVVYSVRTFDQDSSLKTHPGWDDVTGVGSPNAGFLTAFNPS
jgi:subtilase family serine protease